MKYCLFRTITHPQLDAPHEDTEVIDADSISKLIKRLKIDGRAACDLKLYGKTTWTDKHGGVHTLELRQES